MRRQSRINSPRRSSDSAPVIRGRLRRTWLLAVFGLLVVVFPWWMGLWATFPLQRADIHLAKRSELQARSWLTVADWLNGDRSRIALQRARIHRRRNELDGMELELRLATARGASAEVVRGERALAAAQSGRLPEVADYLNQWMLAPGKDVADIADALALGLDAAGRLFETKVILQVWKSDCPVDPKPHVQLARIAENESRPEDTEREYKIALEKNPNFAMALYGYANFLIQRKRPAEAQELLEHCQRIDPETTEAVELPLAKCEFLLGDFSVARARLARLQQLPNSQREQAHLRLGIAEEPGELRYFMAELAFVDQDYQQALSFLELVASEAPDHYNADHLRGMTLQRLGRVQEAEHVLEKVARQRRELADLEPLIKAMHEDPLDYEVRYQIGRILLGNGRAERGLFFLNGVLFDHPDHVATHQLLAEHFQSHATDEPEAANRAAYHRQFLTGGTSD